jgi:pSer/pThr/pTyr-binding forkhead associated (FHA) protein
MLLNNRQVRNVLAGALGGFLSWLLLVEPIVAPQLGAGRSISAILLVDALFGAFVGLGIGFALGAAEGIVDRAWDQVRRGGLIGLGVGLVGGMIGAVVGEIVYQPLAWACFVGRAVAWGVFGAILGVSEGLTRRSWRGVRNGALGGLIGGAIGGFLFDLVAVVVVTLTGYDGISRGVALTVLGASLGFWIAAVERALAPALLKVISGRQEGREFLLDKPVLTLGSAERCDVALFGDPGILPKHATLRWENEVYVLQVESGAEVTVNGQSVVRQALQHEDQLLVGRTRCIFRRKEGQAARSGASVALAPTAAPVLPAAQSGAWPADFPMPAASGVGVLNLVDLRTGQRYPLGSNGARIGRDPGNEILLADPSISGQHAVVRLENGRCVIYDQDSRNGVYVNGRRITGANLLRPGWQVQIGDVVMRLE